MHWIGVLAAAVGSASLSFGQCEPEELTQFAFAPQDVAYSGEAIYVAAGFGGLHVLDAGDPRSPAFASRLPEYARASGVVVEGDRLFVASGDGGLASLDIAEPLMPRPLDALDLGGFAFGLDAEGSLLAVQLDDGIALVDAGDASDLRLLSTWDSGELAVATVIEGDLVFVASDSPDDGGSLQVLDVADPAEPAVVAEVDGLARLGGMRLVGDRLYVASRDGLFIFDVAEPSSPSLVALLRTAMTVADVEIAGDFAFLGVDNGSVWGRLWIVDLTDLSRTNIVSFVHFGEGSARGVAHRDGIVHVAGLRGGLHTIDASDPTAPERTGVLKAPYSTDKIELFGDHAILLEGLNRYEMRLLTLDVAEPANPKVVGWTLLNAADLVDLAVSPGAGIAYVADRDAGVRVFDLTDPAQPGQIGLVELADGASAVVVEGQRLYVDADGVGLHIYDIADPQRPELLGSLEIALGELEVEDEIVYTTPGGRGLVAIDASNPSAPVVIGEFPLEHWRMGVEVEQGLASVVAVNFSRTLESREGLYLIDVNDPSDPLFLSFLDLPVADAEEHESLAFRNHVLHDRLVLVSRRDEILLIDAEDPLRPARVGTLPARNTFSGAAFDGARALLAESFAGLSVHDLRSCTGCPADLDGDDDADADDFFAYLDAFAAGNLDTCDIDGDGDCDADDFFGYLDLFAQGC